MNVEDNVNQCATMSCLAAHKFSMNYRFFLYDGGKTMYSFALQRDVARACSPLVNKRYMGNRRKYNADMTFHLHPGDAEPFIQLWNFVYTNDILHIPKRNMHHVLRLASMLHMKKHYVQIQQEAIRRKYCTKHEVQRYLRKNQEWFVDADADAKIWEGNDSPYSPSDTKEETSESDSDLQEKQVQPKCKVKIRKSPPESTAVHSVRRSSRRKRRRPKRYIV